MAFNEEEAVKRESCQLENCHTNEEGVIAREANSVVKQFLSTTQATMVEESWDYIQRMAFPNDQSVIWSFVYYVIEQIIQDLLCKDAIGEILKTYTAKFFYTESAT